MPGRKGSRWANGSAIVSGMLKLLAPSFLLSVPLLFSVLTSSQQQPQGTLGLFEGATDIGATKKGATVYDAATGEYRVTGGGADMWGAADAFHMSWVRLSGDVTLTADVHFPPEGGAIPLKKAVLIVRQSLDPDSAYADVAIHGDGHITLQYRETKGGQTADITSPEHGSTRLRIERKGDQFTMYTGPADGKLTPSGSMKIVLHDPVYVGIGMCAHKGDAVETAVFSNVKIERAAE
jgi:TolB protein